MSHFLVDGLSERCASQVETYLERIREDRFIPRLLQEDATLFSAEPSQQESISQRLGWVHSCTTLQNELDTLQSLCNELSDEGFERFILVGMGGSSAFGHVVKHQSNGRLIVLDSVVPDMVNETLPHLDDPTTFVLVGSKSGTTVEATTLANLMQDRCGASRMLVITDPGSPLEKHAKDHGYRAVVHGYPTVGGRFSGLSPFGALPALLAGVDVQGWINDAKRSIEDLQKSSETHSAVVVGAHIAAQVQMGANIVLPSLGGDEAYLLPWIEQLVAESCGKRGVGVWPIPSPTKRLEAGAEIVFLENGDCANPNAGRLSWIPPTGLGANIVWWHVLTATVGFLLGINPFDEPDVNRAKELARRQLGSGESTPSNSTPVNSASSTDIESLFTQARAEKRLVSLLLFLPPSPIFEKSVRTLAEELSEHLGLVVVPSFGPRYLHATGQLHKGGSDDAVHLVCTMEPSETGGHRDQLQRLTLAQALGDVEALQERGRPVVHVHVSSGMDTLQSILIPAAKAS
ncbi:MAG: hypothetical protein CMH54_12830 [Myxococcales bacterium]|nr:hypothetical protein [Myxococcales bacterium]